MSRSLKYKHHRLHAAPIDGKKMNRITKEIFIKVKTTKLCSLNIIDFLIYSFIFLFISIKANDSIESYYIEDARVHIIVRSTRSIALLWHAIVVRSCNMKFDGTLSES